MTVTSGLTLSALFDLAVNRHADRLALVEDGKSWTYRALSETVYRLARAMLAAGLRSGNGVAVLLPNRMEAFAIRMAAAVIGVRFTAMNPLGLGDSLKRILEDADVAAFVTDAQMADKAHDVAQAVPGVRLFSIGPGPAEDLLALADERSGSPFRGDFDENQVDALVFTGGTTGREKGVIHPHRVFVHNAMMVLANWTGPDKIRMLLSSPLSHSAAALPLPTMLRGGSVHILPKFDSERVLETIERERITCTLGVPTMLYSLLNTPGFDARDLSSLKKFIYVGSPILSSRLAEAIERVGPVFCQWYGQTEAPNNITQLDESEHDPSRPELLKSCGRPSIGVEVKLLDDAGHEVAQGLEGEICVRGPLVMQGYRNNPDATADALQFGWLHTGDIARADERGYLYIVDRKKDIIISGGLNIYPREVEDVLAQHPAVAQAAVIGVPDSKWGEAVKGILVLREGKTAKPEELQAFVRQRMSGHQVPKSIEIVDAIPLTAIGKPDKQALRHPHWAGMERRVN